MKKFISEHFIDAFKILVMLMVIGVLGGALFTIDEVNAAAKSPIDVSYGSGDTAEHNVMMKVGVTSGYYKFDLIDKGTITSAKWSSSNKSIMTIASTTGKKGKLKCKIKGVKEGHAVLKLTVKTTKKKKNYTYTEAVGVSVCTDIKNKNMHCVSYAIPETYIYRGATTEDFEWNACVGSEYRNKAFYSILYQCGSYYYVEKVCEPTWYKGEIVSFNTYYSSMHGAKEGFVKKAHVSTSASILVHGVEIKNADDNYPLNSGKQFYTETTPVDVPVSCKWSSSNSKVATVSSTGYVKAVGPGEATITASYGKYETRKDIRVTGLVVYDAQSKKNIAYDSLVAIKNEFGKPFSYSNLLPTDDIPYDVAFNVELDPCALCNTSNRYFESLDMFNTNCYGFVINHWSFCNNSTILSGKGRPGEHYTPGDISGTRDDEMLDNPKEVAQLVKNDMEYMGGDAKILEGKDNNPNYPTDENHYLIAIRTHGSYSRNNYDFHFMIKKSGEWYFKDALEGQILKIKNFGNPSHNIWNARYYEHNDRFRADSLDFYNGDVQYMVIPKLPVKITDR